MPEESRARWLVWILVNNFVKGLKGQGRYTPLTYVLPHGILDVFIVFSDEMIEDYNPEIPTIYTWGKIHPIIPLNLDVCFFPKDLDDLMGL